MTNPQSPAALADEALLPCPFCGAGDTQMQENGRMWTGQRKSEPTSVSVVHWCEPVPGQPSRRIERVGRDEASAIAAWNTRATLATTAQATPAAWLHEDGERVITDQQKRRAITDGGASASSVAGYSIALATTAQAAEVPAESPCQFALDSGGNLYRRYSSPVCAACVPAAKVTDQWESSRIGDFNAGWNACRAAMIAAAPPAPAAEVRVPFPRTPADAIDFIGGNFYTHRFATPDGQTLALEDQTFFLSVHDLLSAFNQWADAHGITQQEVGHE